MSYSRPHSPVSGNMHMQSKHRRSSLRSRPTQLLVLRFGWVVLVIWYEVGEFFSSLSNCRFPDAALRKQSSHVPTHIVLVADPHVPHPIFSHPSTSSPWVNAIRQGMEELFMRKSWNVVTRLGRIDTVIVVGDMLDEGRRVMSNEEYNQYHELFRSIFKIPKSDTPMFFVPGNHDIPLGPNRRFSPLARKRYTKHFSEPNTILSIANHSIVLLDSVGLVEEDYRRYAAEIQFGEWEGVENGVIEFVKALRQDPPVNPILISHIPLARSDSAICGPLREHGRIQKGVGIGYQNLLGSDTSRFLLDAIKPKLVFSGDDHDYCEVMHPNGIKEVTIKSFSSSAGIRRPGLQLLSLVPPTDGQISHADMPCFLPDQLGVYTRVYLPLAILTLLFLVVTNIRSAWSRAPSPYDHKPRYTPEEKHYEKPPPLTLPSRRSAQHLQTLAMTGPRERHHGQTLTPSVSAPVSPSHSPRMPANDNDGEWANGPYSPALSRRSSYGADLCNDNGNAAPSGPVRRSTTGLLPPSVLTPTPRRGVMPRMLSAADWASAARAKDMSVLSLVVDRKGPTARIRSFFKWLWRTRNSVMVKTCREFASIAILAAVVWVLMNAYFF